MAALEEKPQTIARSSSASDFVEDDGSSPSAEQDEPSRLPEPLPPVVFTPTRRAMPRRIIALTLGISVVAVILTLFIPGIPWSISSPKDYVYPVVALLLGLLLSLVPVLLCLVQTTAKSRQLRKLDSLEGLPGSGTRYFQVAKIAIESVNPVGLGVDYTLPLITFFVVMLLSCLMLLMSSFALDILPIQAFCWPACSSSTRPMPSRPTKRGLSSSLRWRLSALMCTPLGDCLTDSTTMTFTRSRFITIRHALSSRV